jgi:hypothetical protein
MQASDLHKILSKTFSDEFMVNPVAYGYAVSSPFKDSSVDKIDFYISHSQDGYLIDDDGSYLSGLIAQNIEINKGTRKDLLNSILSQGNAYLDEETYQIKTNSFNEHEMPKKL